ncbi:MAG: NUDIX domain-containing protein, partial [Patescibacteria group bacterium]
IDKGEKGEEAFRREIKEETGLENFTILAIADYAIMYWQNDSPMCGVVNLIKNDHDAITLSFEHASCRWIIEDEVDNFRYIWPPMARMIKNGFKYYKLLQLQNKLQNKL